MKVLRAFVPLPIRLAAKGFATPIERASVWPLMAFLVFPGLLLASLLVQKWGDVTNFISQRSLVRFGQ